jgi:hypothetical protein
MEDTRPFAPLYGPSTGTTAGGLRTSTTVAGTTSAVASTAFYGGPGAGFDQIQIANTSASWAYVNFGVVGVLAAATVAASYPVAPGAVVVVTVAAEVNGASVILSTGTGNVIFTIGSGL